MTPQAAAKELEEVMKRVREAQSFISAAIEPGKARAVVVQSQSQGRRLLELEGVQDHTAQFLHCTKEKTETPEVVSGLRTGQHKPTFPCC